MEGEDTAPSMEYLEGLKRKDLLALCKKHEVKATGKNAELIDKLILKFTGESITETNEELEEGSIEEEAKEEVKEEVVEEENEMNGLAPISVESSVKENNCLDVTLPTETEAEVDQKSKEISPTVEDISKENFTSTVNSPIPSLPSKIAKTSTLKVVKEAPKTASAAHKKFDLKESLKRPLTYKPYKGPLKPFSL